MKALTLITILSACAPKPAASPKVIAPLTGTIDDKPFEARSALMTAVNEKARNADDGRSVTVSTIYVFERVVTCDEIKKIELEERHRLTLGEKERGIQIDVVGPWPRGKAVLITDKDVDAAVQTGESRLDVQGTLTIIEATPWSGAISIEMKNQHSENGARGEVRFAVCR